MRLPPGSVRSRWPRVCSLGAEDLCLSEVDLCLLQLRVKIYVCSCCPLLLVSALRLLPRGESLSAAPFEPSTDLSFSLQLNLNPYDVRLSCDRDESADGPLCYKQMGWIETYLNKPEIRAELGVGEGTFASCNMEVNKAFSMQGDAMHNSAGLLPELLEDGIRVLIYNGVEDFMCNHVGNAAWMEALPSIYSTEYAAANTTSFIVNHRSAGDVRTAGLSKKGAAGAFTFVRIEGAGHMVPFDKPVEALVMFEKWLKDESL